MWNVHSYFVFVPLPLAVYLFYVHIYRAHQLLKSNVVFDCQRLPSLAYLFVKYFVEALRKKMGRLHGRDVKGEAAITIINCRLDTKVLRRFCSAAGYGWDYPDSEYRDIPICFPEILCMRLVVMVISAEWFRLSPMGLFRVSQSIKTFQPIDELKKGAFVLQAHVIEYRLVDAGVEVDITLRAISRSSQPVWESVLTLLSHNQGKDQNKHPLSEFQADCLVSDDSKRGDICVPWTTGLKCIWTFSDYSPHRLLTIPAQLMGYKCPTTPSLWMLSKCLAEIEKHNGAEALRAPISLNVQFQNALVAPGKVVVKFWETTPEDRQSSRKDLSFQVSQPSASTEAPPHLTGQICRG